MGRGIKSFASTNISELNSRPLFNILIYSLNTGAGVFPHSATVCPLSNNLVVGVCVPWFYGGGVEYNVIT